MRVNCKVLDVKHSYQPPYAEIISIEVKGVLCHSAIVADTGANGPTGTEDMVIDTIRL
jgi:hypothetical protein